MYKFTPEVLLSAPRRGAAIPNSAGTKALYTVSTYSFETHSRKSDTKILDLESKESQLFTNDADEYDATWLGDDGSIIWCKSEDNNCTSLIIGDACHQIFETIKIPGPVSDLKAAPLGGGRYVVAMIGKGTPSGELYNETTAPKPLSSALIYTKQFARYWDAFITDNVNQIFYCVINKSDGKYRLEHGLTNSMARTGMTSPFPWFGGTGSSDDFDVSAHGIVFAARDPLISPVHNTLVSIYYVPLSFNGTSEHPKPIAIQVSGLRGVANCPLFSPDGKQAVFLQTVYEEMDKYRLVLVPDIQHSLTAVEIFATDDGKGAWGASPMSTACWNDNGKEVYVTAEDRGTNKLFKVSLGEDKLPEPIEVQGSVSDAFTMSGYGDGSGLLVSSSTFTDNSIWTLVSSSKSTVISENLSHLRKYNISPSQIFEIEFPGANSDPVHAFVLRPSTCASNPSKRCPLALVIHGGPEQSWLNAWSTRWNLLCLAEAGYIVVAVNFHGSTGYGEAFCKSVRQNWGSLPFFDLEHCFDYVKETMPDVDTDNAVALGGSFGGWMTAWIQGQPFAKKFKAFVCHDGQVSNASELGTDDMTGSVCSWKGTHWENRELMDKYDPSRYAENWNTPMLVIHGKNDYRVPLEEGLGMFGILQYKKIPSKFVVFPDENHWVLKPENSLVWHREVYGWINRYSGNTEE